MTKPQNIESIEKATDKSWNEWRRLLNDAGARELEHKAIAELAQQELTGKIDSPGWWAQTIAVAYEQAIGRREPGQKSDGTYEISVSKTVEGTRDDIFTRYMDKLAGTVQFDSAITSNERTSVTPVRSYWKCDLEDGSKITWAFEQKDSNKVLVVVSHVILQSQESANSWRAYWKNYLG